MHKINFKKSLSFCVVASALFLGACSTKKKDYGDFPPEKLYVMAVEALGKEDFEKAVDLFNEVERQHPYSKWATKAQLMGAFVYYDHQKYEKALSAFETFIHLHPSHPSIAYAYYMKALVYYEQILSTKRDQKVTENALRALEEVVRRFPKSSYARDAKVKMDLGYDHLAGKEMEVGRYYLQAGAFGAAIRRFRKVIESYQTTSHTPEALHRLVEAYLSLGLKKEAQSIAAVLGHNYPGSAWYTDTYYLLKGVDLRPQESKVMPSWLNRLLGKKLQG